MNSTPQLLARERGAVAHAAELRSADLEMEVGAETAVGADRDGFAADELESKAYKRSCI